jgi:hypothetical protein
MAVLCGYVDMLGFRRQEKKALDDIISIYPELSTAEFELSTVIHNFIHRLIHGNWCQCGNFPGLDGGNHGLDPFLSGICPPITCLLPSYLDVRMSM